MKACVCGGACAKLVHTFINPSQQMNFQMTVVSQPVALCRIAAFLLLAPVGFANAVRADLESQFDYYGREHERAQEVELLVVAHLKRGSLHYVRLSSFEWEYRAILIIDEVLRGHMKGTELPMTIHNEMEPRVANDTNFEHHPFQDEAGEAKSAYDSPIYLFYLQGGEYQISGDLRKKQLWMLRTHQLNASPNGDTTTSDTPDIWFPGDIQSADYGLYYQALAGEHPEELLKKYAEQHSPLGARCQMYLDDQTMEGISKEPDLGKRAKQLLPFCFFTEERPETATQSHALNHLSSCGETGAEMLVPIFHDPKYRAMQASIVACWSDAQYDKMLVPMFENPDYTNFHSSIFERWRTSYSHTPIPYLIRKLGEENRFWAEQPVEVQDMLARRFVSNLPTKEQQEHRDELDRIISYLRRVSDERAVAVLQATKKFWDDVDTRANYSGYHYRYISYECEKALEKIDRIEAARKQASPSPNR